MISTKKMTIVKKCPTQDQTKSSGGLAQNNGVVSGIPSPQNNRHTDMSRDMSVCLLFWGEGIPDTTPLFWAKPPEDLVWSWVGHFLTIVIFLVLIIQNRRLVPNFYSN